MSDFKDNTKISFSSDKSFGLLFSIVFLILGVLPLYFQNSVNFIFIFASLFFLLVSFLAPNLFKYPNLMWIKLGLLLGKVISPIIMAIIYLSIFFPFNLFFRIFRYDLLSLKKTGKDKTYWKVRVHKINSMHRMY